MPFPPTAGENTVNGVRPAASLHVVHQAADAGAGKCSVSHAAACTADGDCPASEGCVRAAASVLVVALPFEAKTTAAPSAASRELEKLWRGLDAPDGARGADAIDLAAFVGTGSGERFYGWDGSLSTPPCAEGAAWLLAREVAVLDPTLVARFFAAVGGAPGNARPAQPLNERAITQYE